MKVQIAVSAALFVFFFIVFTWLTIPYGPLAENALAKFRRTSAQDISYGTVTAGPLSAKINAIEFSGSRLGDFTVHYSPFSLFSRSVGVTSEGPLKLEGTLSQSECEFNADINPALVNSLTDKAELSGKLTVKGTASPAGRTMKVSVYSDKVNVSTPLGKLGFEKVDADVSVKGNDITIEKLTSKDDMALNFKGVVRFNNLAPERSVVNVQGSAKLLGEQKNIDLKGRLDSLKPSIE